MNERDLSCTQKMHISMLTHDGDLIYYDQDNDEYYRIGESDTCELLSLQDLLDMNRKYYYMSYPEIGDTPSDNKIYEFYESEPYYIQIKGTELISGKDYYRWSEKDSDDNQYIEPIPTNELNVTDLQNGLYYELVYMELPTKVEIDTANNTYYECVGYTCNPVDNPILDEIVNYFVLGSRIYKKEEVATIDTELHNKILNKNKDDYRINAVKYSDSNYYIVFRDAKTDLADVYTVNGELFLEDVRNYYILSNGLYSLQTANGTELYNMSKKLLHTIPSALDFNQYNNDKDLALVNWWDNEGEQYFYKITKNINNPATGDNVALIFIIGGISLVELTLTLLYSMKQKRKA